MKLNCLFLLLLFLLGTTQMQGQIGHKDCANLIKVEQHCKSSGIMLLHFYIHNTSPSTANYISITDGNGWLQEFNVNLPSQTVYSTQVEYPGTPGSTVCFDIKLYNPKEGMCCYSQVCVDIDDCPCAIVDEPEIACDSLHQDSYFYCFDITNPAYSNNTIDRILVSSTSHPDLCVNGSPILTTVFITPIPPGSTGTVCLTLTGCTTPLVAGQVDFFFQLLDSTDPKYCCHINDSITIPECCPGDCSDFTFFVDNTFPNGNNTFSTQIISGISGVVNFTLWAATLPDRLTVTVNGALGFTFVAGTDPCNGGLGTMSDHIHVEPCDTVLILVNIPAACQSGPGTSGWTLDVSCTPNFQTPNPDNTIEFMESEASENTTFRIPQNSLESLVVYPNPAKDILNIKNNNLEFSYESVNVMDNTGRTLIRTNMSGKTDLQIDTKSLSQGTYLLEIIDATGNRTVEKFVKMQ